MLVAQLIPREVPVTQVELEQAAGIDVIGFCLGKGVACKGNNRQNT